MADNYTGTDWVTRTKISTDIMSKMDEGIEKSIEAGDELQEQVSELNSDLPEIQSGFVSAGTFAGAAGYIDAEVTFEKPFSGTPIIVCSLRRNTSATSYCNLTFTTINISSTGFTLRTIYNGSSSPEADANWIAVYNK